jgi:hypothetical protein
MTAESVSRAFESLTTLPALEGGFLRHLLFQAIDDPALALDPALATHLYLVPLVVRVLPSSFVRSILASPSVRFMAANTLDDAARNVAVGRDDISAETLVKLSRIALHDPAFLAYFLDNRPPSPFL